jgi:hypothetical protein
MQGSLTDIPMNSFIQPEVKVSICSGTKENHGEPWLGWPVAEPSGCKLNSRQQSGIKSASPNISPYLCCVFLFFFLNKIFTIIVMCILFG